MGDNEYPGWRRIPSFEVVLEEQNSVRIGTRSFDSSRSLQQTYALIWKSLGRDSNTDDVEHRENSPNRL